jgi:L-lactate dehydrogenase complex protein LldF
MYRWRQELDSLGHADRMKKFMSKRMSFLFNHPGVYTGTLRMAKMMNWMPRCLVNSKMNPWAYGHEMMKFPRKPFHEMIKEELKD